MLVFKKRHVPEKVIPAHEEDYYYDTLCNKCGGSCKDITGLDEITVYGHYGSVILDDLTKYTFSLCEVCLDKLFKEFKIPVEIKDYNLG